MSSPNLPRIGFFFFVALALLSLSGAFHAIVAQSNVQSYACHDDRAECAGAWELQRMRQHYEAHAHVRLGEERRLVNGVAWRFFHDEPTGLAIPRITWMPNRQARLQANRLFDAIHGGALIEWDRWSKFFSVQVKEQTTAALAALPQFPGNPYILPPEVGLTYASPNLVSYFERRVARRPIGRVIDLRLGRIFALQSCAADRAYVSDDPPRFGDFLPLCDSGSFARFVALWASKVEEKFASAEARDDPWAAYCKEAMEPLTRPDTRAFAFYLTPAGLGVYASFFWPDAAGHCMLHRSSINPVIIPWRELEPFMKPGPWRDELLKGAKG